MGAVINKQSYDKITGYLKNIESGNDSTSKIIYGGRYSDKDGYYIDPTIVLTTDPKSKTMVDELFGPVLTVYVYPAEKYTETVSSNDYLYIHITQKKLP